MTTPRDPLHVDVSGALADVRFPNLCARCGAAPPAGALPVARMFVRTYSESPSEYVLATVRVPFCGGCLGRHEQERPPVDPRVLGALRRRWAVKVLPYVVPVGVIGYLLAQFAPGALRSVARLLADPLRPRAHGDGLLGIGIVAFLGLCLLGFVRGALDAGRPLVADDVEAARQTANVEIVPGPLGSRLVVPTPPTWTLSAVSFDDETFALFEDRRRTFRFADADVARQFAAVNADRVWTPSSPGAVRGARQRRLALAAAIASGLVYGIWRVIAHLSVRVAGSH